MASRKQAKETGILPGYIATLADLPSRERYKSKLKFIGGTDPYDLSSLSWADDVDKWPNTTYIHMGMYLAFSPSPYTGEDLANYKNLNCYQ